MYAELTHYLRVRTALDDASLARITPCFSPLEARRGEFLLREGETCRHYYFVRKGCLRLFATNADGVEATRYFAFDGAFGTSLPSFIDQVPAFENVQTIERSSLLRITRADFYRLVDEEPAVAKVYRLILERGFVTAQKRIYGFQGDDALQRLRWVLGYQPDFLARVSNKMAASYLGLTPSTLSRLKGRLAPKHETLT